jgi:hypothetical protein
MESKFILSAFAAAPVHPERSEGSPVAQRCCRRSRCRTGDSWLRSELTIDMEFAASQFILSAAKDLWWRSDAAADLAVAPETLRFAQS